MSNAAGKIELFDCSTSEMKWWSQLTRTLFSRVA
jgi:hypothetical protein